MKIAIMQPYLFPYLGYFQLINAVDTFVIYDDVNHIRRGWINRNRILLNKKEHVFTLRLAKASQNKLIKEIKILEEPANRQKLLLLIKHAYSKAPQFKEIYPMLEKIVLNDEGCLTKYIEFSLRKIAEYLEIKTNLIKSSQIIKNDSLRGQDKILEIIKQLNFREYINPIGGTNLYDSKIFQAHGVKLYFLKTKDYIYRQNSINFIPNLSIVDILMWNTKGQVRKLLEKYELVC